MDALIAIPDLDDDHIYPLNAASTEQSGSNDVPRPPRPFRGAAAGFEHSRSGSGISIDSSSGSKTGTGTAAGSLGGSANGSHAYNNGASGSGSSSSLLRGVGGGTAASTSGPHPALPPTTTAAPPSSMPTFPRKGSFASLRAAFNKNASTPTQDAYPSQLRNPFSGSSARGEAGAIGTHPSEITPRMHNRQDSFISSGSRGRVPPSSSLRHVQQTSMNSEQSHGASTSLSESVSAASGGYRKPPGAISHFPIPVEETQDGPPSGRRAYSRPLANSQTAQASSQHAELGRRPDVFSIDGEQDFSTPYANLNGHYIPGSEQSESAIAGYGLAGYGYEAADRGVPGGPAQYSDPQTPLLPPQRPFADTMHGRTGSSGGSLGMSEDGARGSGDNVAGRAHTPGGSSNPQQTALHPSTSIYANRDNSSVASLPSGIGIESPSSPAEYAINVLCSRFMTLAGVRVRGAIGGVDEADPPLATHLAKGGDSALDTLIDSLAHISRKNPRPVVESLLHWRETIAEERVDVGDVRGALAGSHSGLGLGVKNVAEVLARRKFLASAYLLTRVLAQVSSQFSHGGPDNPVKGMTDAHLGNLHKQAFELMRECSRDRCPPSKMQADAFENAAKLIGELSKSSFTAIGDRFVAYLEQCQRNVPSSKDGDGPTEIAIWAVRYLTITPYPMELFEEGAEFFETIAKFFSNAHGQKIKSGYADALTQLILPVAKSASAELHHPTWIRALDFIGPRAFAMLQKPRYWLVAYPLYTAVLCVSPEERFLHATQTWSWFACLDAGVSKMSKDRTARIVVLNASLCLFWTYLFRCRESSATTAKRIDAYSKIWFPHQRQAIWPIDIATIEWHVYMLHYLLYRQFELGRDMILDFLRHSALSGNKLSLQPELLSKQRMTIAIRAVILTLDAHVRCESPPFPSDSVFRIERDGLGDELPEGYTYPTTEIGNAQATFNDLIGKIALLCDHAIGSVTIMDEGVTLYKGSSLSAALASAKGTADEERLNWRVHETNRFIAAYPKEHQPTMDLLRTCIESWPRCLSASIAFPSVLSLLFRAQFSADSRLSAAATQCLIRLASQRKGGAVSVVSSFMRSIVRLQSVAWETHPKQLIILIKVERAFKSLVNFLSIWLTDLKKTQASGDGLKSWEMERTSAWAVIDEVEAIGLFVLCSAWRPLRRQAIGILRAVADLDDVFAGTARRTAAADDQEIAVSPEPTRIIHLLSLPIGRFSQPTDPRFSEEADTNRTKSQKWKRSSSADEALLEIAESDKVGETNSWSDVVPRFLRACLEHFPTTVAVFRSIVANRIFGMEAAVSQTAGISNRNMGSTTGTLKSSSSATASSLMSFAVGNNSLNPATAGSGMTPEQTLMSDHWKMYVLALCTTTTSIEGGGQRILQGEGSSERIIAAKDLFQKMVPYLASDQPRFQDAVIVALGNININLYKTLLETLQMVNSQLSEDFRRTGSKRNIRNERLRTALAHVIHLTSPHMTRERTLNDQSIVFLVLQWIKDTFNFLTDRDIRTEWEFHQLRRYFAGVVEEFFEALQQNLQTGNDAAQRFLTLETRLRMFRLFRDWHSFSQAAKDGPARLTNLLATVAEQHREDRNREHILTRLRTETQLLSLQASSAMAALCQSAMVLADLGSNRTQTNGNALAVDALIEWLEYLFRSTTTQNHDVATRALKGLLRHNASNVGLARSTMEHAFLEPETRTSSNSFFAVLSDVIVERSFVQDNSALSWQQIACLGLIKLGHFDIQTRKKAFEMLHCIASTELGSHPLHALEGGVSSPLPATYLRAQRDVSTHLANCFPQHKIAMLSEYTYRMPGIDASRRATTLGLLPEWLSQIRLVGDDLLDARVEFLPHRAALVLSNLLAMTIRYGDEHNFEIQDMWASLAESDAYNRNATIIAKFLIQQALILRSSSLVMHAKRAVSCLSHTVLADALFTEFCSYIEPSSMIPVPLEHERAALLDPALGHLFTAKIEDMLPTPSRRQTFSPGQVALLYVGELTYDRSAIVLDKLPLLLHAIFMQVDSVSEFAQEQVMAMFEQMMRLINTGGNEDNTEHMENLFGKGTSIFWTQDDEDFDDSHTLASMRTTVMSTLAILGNHINSLKAQWGNVALHWATSNPVRHMACRSFQLFRILLPDVNYTMLADMLGRLSNTVSDPARIDNQSFALEILYTLNAIVRKVKTQGITGQDELLSHVFWMNVACLSTVNEAEYAHAITLMLALLECIKLDRKETVVMLKSKCPEGWEGDTASLQGLIMRGLKSSALCEDSFRLLAELARVQHDELIETSDSRVGYLFTACMPWFLQMTDDPTEIDEAMVSRLAQDISLLAQKHNQPDIERVASSIAKKRFRTKDDLLRQAVGSCKRTGFIPKHTSGVVFLLLGLTFNAHDWIRKQTLQLLKILFQSMDARRRDLDEYGPELLMPLLRLLSTKHSMEALEVLDEKILSNGPSPHRLGPNAQQILRMSLQWHKAPAVAQLGRRGTKSGRGGFAASSRPLGVAHVARPSILASANNSQEINSIFGLPEESGWSVANVLEWSTRTRINIVSVFKEVEQLLDTPPVGEVNFVDDYDGDGDNIFEQAMTLSRIDAEEGEANYSEHFNRASQGITSGELNGTTADGASTTSHIHDSRNSIGDIVNQLHDLSSFFIDDETGSTRDIDSDNQHSRLPASVSSSRRGVNDQISPQSVRKHLFWSSSSSSSQGDLTRASANSNSEDTSFDVAKILGRSALAAMMGRSQGRVVSGTSDESQNTPTPMPQDRRSEDGAGNVIDYLTSKSLNDEPSPKRSGVFGRKGFFARKVTPTAMNRTASDTERDTSVDRSVSARSDANALDDSRMAEKTFMQSGDTAIDA